MRSVQELQQKYTELSAAIARLQIDPAPTPTTASASASSTIPTAKSYESVGAKRRQVSLSNSVPPSTDHDLSDPTEVWVTGCPRKLLKTT
eukprot:17906-Alexandrium_andersonii.AAC.1